MSEKKGLSATLSVPRATEESCEPTGPARPGRKSSAQSVAREGPEHQWSQHVRDFQQAQRLIAKSTSADVNGESVIRSVYRASEVYSGGATALSPDLIVGYRRGYRASWATCLGDLTPEVLLARPRLVQLRDAEADDFAKAEVKTKRVPTDAELGDLKFAWIVAKHVKSNAIVLAKGRMIVGVGAGQMSRIDSTHIATRKAGERVAGSVVASDAFFPFRDNVDLAAASGIKAIVQPGGSMRDQDSIDACNEHGIAMIFTGVRHFRH